MATFLHIFTLALFLVSCFTNGEVLEAARCLRNNPAGYRMIYVDPSNRSTSIQAAIDSVPSNNKDWVVINIKAGVYKGQVKIPADKQFIYLKGEGMGRTVLTWNAHDSMLSSATFETLANNTFASEISFVNSYNDRPAVPALAAKVSGDKTAFFECSFVGYQDTLLDDMGRHYFKGCYIEGAVDFIFGSGQSIYQKCTIYVNAPGMTGFIAAQGRESPKDSGGFVFKSCNISGNGKTFLGRAWKSYSRVLYFRSYLSDIVVPQGWDAWNARGQEYLTTFVEERNRGPGSNKSGRVKWEKRLNPTQLTMLTKNTYIDSDKWLHRLPNSQIHDL